VEIVPVAVEGPGLEAVFGPQTGAAEDHIRNVLVRLGQEFETTARRVTGRSTGSWGDFGFRHASSDKHSLEGRFNVAVVGAGEVACSVELFATPRTNTTPTRWEIFVNIAVSVVSSIDDGLARPQYNKHFSASSSEQALSKLADAVKDLDERMMRPPSHWIAKGRMAGE
jgi:hypothetical protein